MIRLVYASPPSASFLHRADDLRHQDGVQHAAGQQDVHAVGQRVGEGEHVGLPGAVAEQDDQQHEPDEAQHPGERRAGGHHGAGRDQPGAGLTVGRTPVASVEPVVGRGRLQTSSGRPWWSSPASVGSAGRDDLERLRVVLLRGPLLAHLADPQHRGADQHDPGDDRDGPAGGAVLGGADLDAPGAADRRPVAVYSWARTLTVPLARPCTSASLVTVRPPGATRPICSGADGQPLAGRRAEDELDPDGVRVGIRPGGGRSLRIVIGEATPSWAVVLTLAACC